MKEKEELLDIYLSREILLLTKGEMSLREKVYSAFKVVQIHIRRYRKEALSAFIFATVICLNVWIGTDWWGTNITTFIGGILLSTDYKVLQLVSPPLYTWIEDTVEGTYPTNPIDTALSMLQVNYYAKRYDELGNPKLKVIEADDRSLRITVEDYQNYVTPDMIFQLFFEDEIQYFGESIPTPKRLGLARVDNVSTTTASLTVIEWENSHKREQRMLRKGETDRIKPFVKVALSEEVEKSSLSELEDAYESVRDVFQNRGELPQ